MKKEVGAKSQINDVTIIELEESTELESELQLENNISNQERQEKAIVNVGN